MSQLSDDLAAGIAVHEDYDLQQKATLASQQDSLAQQANTIASQAATIGNLNVHIDELELKVKELEEELHPEPPYVPHSIGIRVLPTKGGSVYRNFAAVLDHLDALNVDLITHKTNFTMQLDVQKFTQDAAALGIKSACTVGEPRAVWTTTQWDSWVKLMTTALAGHVTVVYPGNENNHLRNPDDIPMTGWAQRTVTQTKALRRYTDKVNLINASNGHEPIEVALTSLWSGDIPQQFSDLSELVAAGLSKDDYDIIAWHLYMRGEMDPAMLDEQEHQYRTRLDDPDSPIFNTETGYNTATSLTGGAFVTEERQAELTGLLIDEHKRRGWRLGLFELNDDPDPTGTNREAHFGWLRCPSNDPATWSEKPVCDVVRAAVA